MDFFRCYRFFARAYAAVRSPIGQIGGKNASPFNILGHVIASERW